MAQDITYAYVGGLTAKRGEDGFMRVKGLATDDTLDLDEQICDPQWLAKAMPEWLAIGNIREMHQSKAVGKAVEMEQSGTGYIVEAKIVDKEAAMKVEEGIYTGFSVGIKNAKVIKDAAAPGGRIVSGKVVEVSLVDRPANPSAVIEIAKTVGGTLTKGMAVDESTLKYDQVTEMRTHEPVGTPTEVYEQKHVCTSCAGTGKKTNVPEGEDATCEVCKGTGVQPEGELDTLAHHSPSIPQDMDNHEIKGTEPEVEKREFTEAEREAAAEEGAALPDGSYPIKSVADLKNAIQAYGRAKDPAKVKAHIKARAEALGREDLIPENWKGVEADLAKADEMMHDAADLKAVRESLINLIKAELDEMLAGTENEIGDVCNLVYTLSMFLDWWTKEASENETEAPFTGWDMDDKDDDMAYIGLGVSADLIKSATSADATDTDRDALRSEIVKALGLTETITKAELAAAKEEINLLKAALEEVKEMAAPGGPALRATGPSNTKSAQATALQVEAERRRFMASQVTDPNLRNQYLDAAKRLDAEAAQL